MKWYARREKVIRQMWPFFTRREQDVLLYREQGWTLSRVGSELGLTKQAVSAHEHSAKARIEKFQTAPRPARRQVKDRPQLQAV